jgi:hypothetical protein
MPFIKVLKPQELRDEVRKVVRAYLKEM